MFKATFDSPGQFSWKCVVYIPSFLSLAFLAPWGVGRKLDSNEIGVNAGVFSIRFIRGISATAGESFF